ncbi:MAG: CPBP family intramembrane metalloprotease [Lachnospiraceae bacterium]|nr:CPBP family intramembrane metalloprotease [Lachnospiraceae bacterium]
MNPKNSSPARIILQKILALLCFLVLPLLFYVLTAYLTAAVFQVLLSSMDEGAGAARFLEANLPIVYSGAAALVTVGVLGPLYRRFRRDPLLSVSPRNPETGCPKRRDHPSAASGYLCAAAFGSFGAVFFNLLLALSRLPELFPSAGTIGAAGGEVNAPLHFLVVCLLLPTAEELVFRGLGYFGLRRFYGPAFTGVLTAALFGVFHGNAPQTLYGFCMGLLLAHTAEACRNLTGVLLFHWAANVTSFFFLGDPTGQRLIYSIPFLGLSGIGCVWLFYRVKDLGR